MNVQLKWVGIFIIGVIISACSTPSSPEKEVPHTETPTLTDIDGNTYPIVQIGNQWWMAKNLQVTQYRNGDALPQIKDSTQWGNLQTGAWCIYENLVSTYGKLYNWYAVADPRHLAPQGWHIPTDKDWKQLEMTLGMSAAAVEDFYERGTDEGGQLKATHIWRAPNTGATNRVGFSALPGGLRIGNGDFAIFLYNSFFWTATAVDEAAAYYRYLSYDNAKIGRLGDYKQYGFSVRCVKDSDTVLPKSYLSQ